MVTIRNANDIIQGLVDFLKLAQPNLDTKAGTVSRDLIIEAPASQISILYDELGGISNKQSLRLVSGSDLDKLAMNYGLVRKNATTSSGTALYTFSTITATININPGDTATANNGITFSVINGVSVTPANINLYKSIASKFSAQLATAGITDQYAVQVTLRANSAGSSGNIGIYSLLTVSTASISNVTNVSPFTGGTDQESDTTFRNRILSTFSGSSVGTALGYLNTALGVTGVQDAYVVQPGDPLMVRDGSIVKNGVVISEGTGGKVNIIIMGSNLQSNTDSYIYVDQSNNNDPTSSKNNVVLGQIAADLNKTINRKRIDDIANGQLPTQPIDAILTVSGSVSGSNFVSESIDKYGRVFGNYKLINDTGVYGGSPWGFDTFAWISNQISLFPDDRVKGQFNGQDAVTYTGLLAIPNVQQNISITNENSTVTSDRSIIQLLHTPATNVTRVYNVNTGERYVVVNQNVDNTGTYNTTGRIQISGNTLPSTNGQLQVDYTWIINYDQYSDYDGLEGTNNPRPVTNSIDWGYASEIIEKTNFSYNSSSNFFTGTVSHPISTVLTAKMFTEVNGIVSVITSGVNTGRLCVILNNLTATVSTVDSVLLKNNNAELYATAQNNGSFIVSNSIVGITLYYGVLIILPTDTTAMLNQNVSVYLNGVDTFNITGNIGSFNGTQITIPASSINPNSLAMNNIILKVNYIANVPNLCSLATTSLPISRISNGFILSNNNGFNNISQANISRREFQIIQNNSSSQLYIELNLSATDYSLSANQVLSIIRLSDFKELWNSDNIGTIQVGNDGNYQIIFNGVNTPAIGNRVLIIYYATDLIRFQPFSYSNYVLSSRIDTLGTDPATGRLSLAINKYTSKTNVNFSVLIPNTDISLLSGTDGVLTAYDGYATLTSSSLFSSLPGILNYKVRVTGFASVFDNGLYDITAINGNIITISQILTNITVDQICVLRILDGQEVWNYSGAISGNQLLLQSGVSAVTGDSVYVIFYNFNTLRRAATRLSATTVDQIINPGVLSIFGTTLYKADNVVFTATTSGLGQDVTEAIETALSSLSVSYSINSIKVVRVMLAEKVITYSSTDNTILETTATYDVKESVVFNNLYYPNELLSNPSFAGTYIQLPSTTNNTNNAPVRGDKINISFYYTVDNDLETLSYTKNGTLFTNKKFALINKIYAGSGFKSSQSTRLTIATFTQPNLGSRYRAFYNYLAPQPNERIMITYNYNQIITNATFAIEASRPINADVLAYEAQEVLIDLTMNVVIDSTYLLTSTAATALQTLRNQLITAMTTTKLGQNVSTVTLINVAQSVTGIDRARVLYFNVTGTSGTVISIQAANNQYLVANNIVLNTENL
jgi:hypothetical protein